MSLQVFSPHSHTHSNDPQSPFPCTPSTLCSSPVPNANNTNESDRSTSSSSSSYFRTSHHAQHQHHRQRQISSPLCQLANAFQDHQRGRESPGVSQSPITHSDNIDGDTTIMHETHHVNHHYRETRTTTRRRDDTSSVIDSPEMPMSIRSPSMSTLGGHHTPEEGASRRDLFESPRECHHAASSPRSSQPSSGMRTHPSAASIPIILAGLNGIKALGRERKRRDGLRHGKEMSGDTVEIVDMEEERVGGESDADATAVTIDQEQRGSMGSIGLGILQDPIQSMDTRRISNTPSGGRKMHQYNASEQEGIALSTCRSNRPEEPSLSIDLDAHRQDRADSWTSSLVSTGDDSLASSRSSHRRPSTPDASLHLSSVPLADGELSIAHEVYASGHEHQVKYASNLGEERMEAQRHIEVLPVFPQPMRSSIQSAKEKMDSPSQGSEFSISAYDYSPHVPQGETWTGVTTEEKEEEEDTLSKVAPARRSRVASCTVIVPGTVKDHATQNDRQQVNEPPTPISTKSSMKKKKKAPATPSAAEMSLDSPKAGTVKKRRRAVTIANPPEAHDASENLRRQSSPPTLSTARFATGSYATLSPAALVKKQYEATTHRPVGMDQIRPSTSLAGTATPSRLGLGAPLSLRPSTAGAASSAANRHISPAALFKPLPALPTPKQSQEIPSPAPSSSRNRSGFLSVQTSPRKTTFSRPGTASPAARSFGLVAPYTNLSPTYRDYRSLKSRESFSSLLNNHDTKKQNSDDKSGNTRSRSTSVSSRASTGKTSKRGRATELLEKYTGPSRYISFAIDQESFREICPIFELVETVQQPVKLSSSSGGSSSDSTNGTTTYGSTAATTTTTYRYLPIHADQAYPFHHATLEPPPILRRLLIDKYEKYDFINRQSVLPIKNEGIYAVKGSSAANNSKDSAGKGDCQPSWRFEYRVMDRVNLLGKPIPGEKNLIPMAFTCSPEVLDPANARKRKAMDVVYKTLSSKLEALRVGDLPPDCM